MGRATKPGPLDSDSCFLAIILVCSWSSLLPSLGCPCLHFLERICIRDDLKRIVLESVVGVSRRESHQVQRLIPLVPLANQRGEGVVNAVVDARILLVETSNTDRTPSIKGYYFTSD